MQPTEVRAAGALATQALGATTSRIEELHGAIAERSFGSAPSPTPAREMHDAIAGGVYAVLRGLGGALGRAGAAAIAATRPPDAAPLDASPRANLALGAISGAFGDALERDGNALAVPMTLRVAGADIPPDADALAHAYPDATGRLAVFVHGLCETDAAWHRGSSPTYGARLREDLGFTALTLRYNSGLRISENGRRLADLLDAVAEHWPVAVEDLVLVGHSMGGLVIRSACHDAAERDERWPGLVRNVVYLGAPHHGAPLEKVTSVAMHALRAIPEARPIVQAINARSVGIKDLRYGTLVEADWRDVDPDDHRPDARSSVPLAAGARHHAISACLGASRDDLLSRMAGDLLVRYASASGTGSGERALPFEVDDCCHLDGLTHFDLLNHPAVYERLHGWLARRQLPAG